MHLANLMQKKQSEISKQSQRMEAELTKRDTTVAVQSEAIMALQEQLRCTQECIKVAVHSEVHVELNHSMHTEQDIGWQLAWATCS